MRKYIASPSLPDNLKGNLEQVIAEAIYRELEEYYPGDLEAPFEMAGVQRVIDNLFELTKCGPKGRITPEVLNLEKSIQTLVLDTFQAIKDAIESEREKAQDRALDPYPGRLYPEADFN